MAKKIQSGKDIKVKDINGKGETNTLLKIDFMTPKEIIKELDKYVIGQDKAKKSVAIALRTRFRRNNVPAHITDFSKFRSFDFYKRGIGKFG